ncbi:MAG TPA: hypothetical protein VGA02_10175 [Gemmatimonadales bacterium]
MKRPTGLLLLGLAGAAGPAAAQSAALRLGVGQVRADQVLAAGDTVARSGMAVSLDGAFGVGPATLAVRYLEGSLASDDAGRETDLVEGEVILWVAPFRWAALGAGRHLRSYVESGGTERWATWEIRGRGTAQLTTALTAYGELWTVVGSAVPVTGPLETGMGLEGGLRFALGRFPFSAHLRYRVDRLAVPDAGRRETVEQLGIAVGVGRR